jgi:hypothetical protein
MQKGFLTLKQDGILKVLKGETTLKQILAVTVDSHLINGSCYFSENN